MNSKDWLWDVHPGTVRGASQRVASWVDDGIAAGIYDMWPVYLLYTWPRSGVGIPYSNPWTLSSFPAVTSTVSICFLVLASYPPLQYHSTQWVSGLQRSRRPPFLLEQTWFVQHGTMSKLTKLVFWLNLGCLCLESPGTGLSDLRACRYSSHCRFISSVSFLYFSVINSTMKVNLFFGRVSFGCSNSHSVLYLAHSLSTIGFHFDSYVNAW